MLRASAGVVANAIAWAKDVRPEAIAHVPEQGDKLLRALELLKTPSDDLNIANMRWSPGSQPL